MSAIIAALQKFVIRPVRKAAFGGGELISASR